MSSQAPFIWQGVCFWLVFLHTALSIVSLPNQWPADHYEDDAMLLDKSALNAGKSTIFSFWNQWRALAWLHTVKLVKVESSYAPNCMVLLTLFIFNNVQESKGSKLKVFFMFFCNNFYKSITIIEYFFIGMLKCAFLLTQSSQCCNKLTETQSRN